MTDIDTTAHEILAEDSHPGQEAAPKPKIGKKALLAIAGALVLLLGGGVAIAASADHNAWVSQVEQWQAEVDATAAQADTATSLVAEHSTAIETLAAQITAAEAVIASTAGQVADDQVRIDLQTTIDAAIALRDAEPVFDTETITVEGIERDSLFTDGSRAAQSFDVITSATPSIDELVAAGAAVETASATVTTAQAQWAYDSLNAAIMNARDAVLPASAGKVADDAVRQALQAAIDAALPASDAGAGMTPVADLIASRDALNAAALVVTDAQVAWEAEQARIAAEAEAARVAAAEAARVAAEQAAAAQRRAASSTPSTSSRTGSSGSSSGSGSSSSGSSSSGGSSSGGSSAPAPAAPKWDTSGGASGGGYDTVWCFDSAGTRGVMVGGVCNTNFGASSGR